MLISPATCCEDLADLLFLRFWFSSATCCGDLANLLFLRFWFSSSTCYGEHLRFKFCRLALVLFGNSPGVGGKYSSPCLLHNNSNSFSELMNWHCCWEHLRFNFLRLAAVLFRNSLRVGGAHSTPCLLHNNSRSFSDFINLLFLLSVMVLSNLISKRGRQDGWLSRKKQLGFHRDCRKGAFNYVWVQTVAVCWTWAQDYFVIK